MIHKKPKLSVILINLILFTVLALLHIMTNYKLNETIQMYYYGLRIILLINCFIIIIRFKIRKLEIGFICLILGFLLEFLGDYLFIQEKLREESLLFINLIGFFNIFGLIILIHGVAHNLRNINNLTNSLENLAYYDQLTGLKNRNYLLATHPGQHINSEHVEYDLPRFINSKHAAVLFLDIDDFKLINDFAGHGGGDKILMVTANRLQSLSTQNNVVIRISGDEFLIIINAYKTMENLEQEIVRIQQKLNEPILLKENTIRVNTSVGCALYPEHGDQLEMLMRSADIAMYQAKRSANDKYCIFEEELEISFNEQFHQLFNQERMK
jgi:diguanylate cyclase (GGDEF)-like protein